MKIKVKKANLVEKIIGVMFQDKILPLYFETRWGIHTFFVKKPIKVLVLDKNNKLVLATVVKPNRIFVWNPIYKKVIEVHESFLRKKLKIGDKIEIAG